MNAYPIQKTISPEIPSFERTFVRQGAACEDSVREYPGSGVLSYDLATMENLGFDGVRSQVVVNPDLLL